MQSESTRTAMNAFKRAWECSIVDYRARLLNCEHTLQATVYHHLRSLLPTDYVVYTEAKVLPLDDHGAKPIFVDLLICLDTMIVVAIEIKFTPRGRPTDVAVTKDLRSLSRITSRRKRIDRVEIDMPRFNSSTEKVRTLTISTERKLVFAAYCRGSEGVFPRDKAFWQAFRPDDGYWERLGSLPKNLGVAMAWTSDDGDAQSDYYGGAFSD